MADDDFYEDDEPIEKIRADYAAGEPGVTVPKRTRKSEDFVQRMKRVVDESTAESKPLSVTLLDLFPFQRRIIRHPVRGRSPRSAPGVPVSLPQERT